MTWDRSSYPQVVGDLTDVGGTTRHVDPTAAYDFANATVTEVDKTVTVTDNQHTFVPAWTITWSAQGTTHTSDVYSRTPSVSAGSCSAVLDNTATMTGSTTGVLGTDSAYGKVCVGADLVVAKNKTVSMTRTYLWQIQKTRTSAASITSGQSADYSVTVSRAAGLGYADSGWQMTGVITVTNPNTFEPVTMTSLVDQYNGDNDGANSCQVTDSRPVGTTTWGAVNLTLEKNAAGFTNAREYKYTCTFTNKPDYGLPGPARANIATATWDAASAATPNGTATGSVAVVESDWTLAATPVNKVITVVDNQYTGGGAPNIHVLGTLDWDNAPHTYTYSLPWTVPAGTCADKDNTATIVETGQYSSATVNVCNPVGLTIRKVDVQTGSTVTGAHFRIWSGTDTSATPVYNDLAEGDAADKDPTAGDGVIRLDTLTPGTYTVREIQAPSGYTIAPACDATHTAPNCDTQTVVLGTAGAQTLSFNDLKPWSPLTAKKTAQGDYDAHYDWTIAKAVRHGSDAYGSSSSYNSSNATENFDWKVSIGEAGRTESNWKVSGAITISNPNSASVLATVSESLTPCTIYDPTDTTPPLTALTDASAAAGFQVSVPANGGGAGTVYQYLCTQTSKAATSNTATVSVNRHDYPRSWDDWFAAPGATYDAAATAGGTLSPSITWTEHNPDGSKTITVTDVLQGTATTHLNSGAPWTHTYGDHADPTWNGTSNRFEHVYSSPVTATAGSCASVTNTAAITGTALAASATATHCTGADLAVTKNKTVSMTRTYLWQIQKTRTSAASITSGQSADYSVTVSRAAGLGYADSGWQMTGVITVTNPNTFEPVTMTSLVDQYNGDNDGANSCQVTDSRPVGTTTWGAVNLTLEKNAAGFTNAREYKYTCTFTNKPDYGLPGPARANIATATWDAASAATPNGTATGSVAVVESDWTLAATPVNKVITVVDNQYTGGGAPNIHVLGTLDWDNAPHTYTYSLPWTVPAGTCADKDNTATIVETKQDSSATVEVCNPLDLSVSKSATGSYTRTYQWDLLKQIVGASTFTGDSYDHTFNYLVSLKENGVQDSAWKVDGTITVTNSNTDTSIPAYNASVTDAMTGVGGSPTCQWKADGDPSATWAAFPASVSVASDTSKVLDYTCSFASQPTYSGGTNKATATWTGGSASSNNVAVNFTETTSVDKTVKVTDDKTSGTQAELPNSPVTYGSHGSNPAWMAADNAYEFPYLLPLSYDTGSYTPPTCEPFPNTAKVLGHGDTVLDTATATAQICPTVGTWTVAKDVAEQQAVPVGTTLHYTLTAHKTSVVDAKNVVLYDDLSDLAPHITGDPVFAAPAGTTVVYNSSTHVLTWTIPTLGSTDRTLGFTVTVASNAYNVDLPNLVTSPGSDNCPDVDHVVAACKTDNKTPHYTLRKNSDKANQTVMPPYYAQAQGTLITYTLTVHNDSQVPINSTTMPNAQVTDDLSDVLDNATWVGNLTPSGQAVFDGNHTLTWTLPTIAAGADATLTYQVRVNADQWNETLTNVATPGSGGECVPVAALAAAPTLVNPNCTTTSRTPSYGMLQALKVDADTQAPLPGASFALYEGTVTLPTTATPLATATSGADGTALFDIKLRPGDFTIVETAAPTGYGLPAGGGDVRHVTLTESDMDNGDPATQVTFNDPPVGTMAVSKAHQELVGGLWVPGDGSIAFNDQVKYVMTVTATGTKVFHNVKVTDYVPGYNPADTQTQLGGFKGVIDTSSIKCSAVFTTCTTSYDAATGLVTWTLGNVGAKTGTVEFVVRMPDLPRVSPLAAPGVAFAGLMWNQAYLAWTQVDTGTTPHTLTSNAVTDAANEVLPPKQVKPQHHPAVLPNTGGPDRWLPAAGLALLLAGAALVAGDRRRKHRS